jgi:hypothetical protein
MARQVQIQVSTKRVSDPLWSHEITLGAVFDVAQIRADAQARDDAESGDQS